MARGNQGINDQLFRTRGRNAAENRETQEEIRRRQIRSWIILVCVALAVGLGIHFLGRYGKGKEIGLSKLPCYSNQNVTPFRHDPLEFPGGQRCEVCRGTVEHGGLERNPAVPGGQGRKRHL